VDVIVSRCACVTTVCSGRDDSVLIPESLHLCKVLVSAMRCSSLKHPRRKPWICKVVFERSVSVGMAACRFESVREHVYVYVLTLSDKYALSRLILWASHMLATRERAGSKKGQGCKGSWNLHRRIKR